ncbi:hypothetical protein EJB05_06509, partial [Eragrostis curvula]
MSTSSGTDDNMTLELRHLPPRSLAASRRVCRAWRDAVDDHRLLRADLLPLAVRGFFLDYCALGTEFFSRPTTGPAISGDLGDFVPGCWKVEDHCNGLLFCLGRGGHSYVANPATRQAARLPPRPGTASSPAGDWRMAFEDDEAARVPGVRPCGVAALRAPITDPQTRLHLEILQSEWPPASYALQVFSSQTGRWEERLFIREGISMSDTTYKLVPMPTSEKGVYCAFGYNWHGLQIFHLDESHGQTRWVLKHSVDLKTFARKLHARGDHYGQKIAGPWVLQNIHHYKYSCGDNKKAIVEEKFEWDSDDDNLVRHHHGEPF